MVQVPPRAQRDAGAVRDGAPAAGPALAGVWLVIGGSLSVLLGVTGIAEDSLFHLAGGYAYRFDLTAWGWINLVIGVAVGIAGVGVLAGAPWARTAGLLTAAASLISQFMFIPYYPWWSISVMTLDLLAIWTLGRFDPVRR
ncbi:DUF7144 family membrane protein [Catenulispora acidiphila]|nr:hypothetical protein [Catenulispora acidiphila]